LHYSKPCGIIALGVANTVAVHLPSERRAMPMDYVTWPELLQFCLVILGVLGIGTSAIGLVISLIVLAVKVYKKK
jgi:hypothetical protein